MAPLRGWAPRGQRIKAKVPHWQTFVAALRHDRITAPGFIDEPINGEAFLLYIEQVLVPTLQPGDIVIWSNLCLHSIPDLQPPELHPEMQRGSSKTVDASRYGHWEYHARACDLENLRKRSCRSALYSSVLNLFDHEIYKITIGVGHTFLPPSPPPSLD
jgi:hypothetical protein